MDSPAVTRRKALPSVFYSLDLLHLTDIDTITEMQSSAKYHKVNQALKSAQRAKQATKPLISSPRSVHEGRWTLGDKSVFASAISRYSTVTPAVSLSSST